MATLLERELLQFKEIRVTQKVQANGVFASFPKEIIAPLQQEHFFYIWNDRTAEARLMCAFDTTEEEIKNFGKKIRELL